MEFVKDIPPEAPRTGRPNKTIPQVEELKAHPGEWAVLRRGAKFTAAGSAHRNLGCEVKTRKQPNGTFDIYVRWPA